jgi:hypothetical protein
VTNIRAQGKGLYVGKAFTNAYPCSRCNVRKLISELQTTRPSVVIAYMYRSSCRSATPNDLAFAGLSSRTMINTAAARDRASVAARKRHARVTSGDASRTDTGGKLRVAGQLRAVTGDRTPASRAVTVVR